MKPQISHTPIVHMQRCAPNYCPTLPEYAHQSAFDIAPAHHALMTYGI